MLMTSMAIAAVQGGSAATSGWAYAECGEDAFSALWWLSVGAGGDSEGTILDVGSTYHAQGGGTHLPEDIDDGAWPVKLYAHVDERNGLLVPIFTAASVEGSAQASYLNKPFEQDEATDDTFCGPTQYDSLKMNVRFAPPVSVDCSDSDPTFAGTFTGVWYAQGNSNDGTLEIFAAATDSDGVDKNYRWDDSVTITNQAEDYDEISEIPSGATRVAVFRIIVNQAVCMVTTDAQGLPMTLNDLDQ